MNKHKIIHDIILLLMVVFVMSTMSACGKSKETAVGTEPATVESTEPTTEDESVSVEPVEESSVEESAEAVPSPEPTESVAESSEEESSEELTVDMSKVKTFDAPKTMYAVKNVNARKGPSVDFDSLGMLKAGEMIEVIGQDEGGWYELK